MLFGENLYVTSEDQTDTFIYISLEDDVDQDGAVLITLHMDPTANAQFTDD